MKTKRKIFLVADIIIICLTLAFIWGNSMLSQVQSAGESEQVYGGIKELLDTVFGVGVITEGLIRKFAHFFEFFVLAVELNLVFVILKDKRALGFIFSLLFGLFVAFFDETLQIFSGRGALITDVILDFSAVVLVTAVFILIYIIRKKKIKN